jgi:hypothetical protein
MFELDIPVLLPYYINIYFKNDHLNWGLEINFLTFIIFYHLIGIVEIPIMLENVLAQQSDSNQRISQEDTVREVYKNPEVEPRSSKEVSSQLAEEELRNSQERSNELAEEE